MLKLLAMRQKVDIETTDVLEQGLEMNARLMKGVSPGNDDDEDIQWNIPSKSSLSKEQKN